MRLEVSCKVGRVVMHNDIFLQMLGRKGENPLAPINLVSEPSMLSDQCVNVFL